MLRVSRAVALGTLLSVANITIAADVVWEGDVSTDWAVPDNWAGGFLPSTFDSASIFALPVEVTSNVGLVNAVNVGAGGSLEVANGGALEVFDNAAIGIGTPASLTVSGGTLHTGLSLVTGVSSNSTIDITGGTVTIGDDNVGGALLAGIITGATATINMSGGELRQGNVDLTLPASENNFGQGGATGILNLSGGSMSFRATTYVGGPGGSTGVVTQTGGFFETRERAVRLGGDAPGTTGTYNISAGTLKTGTGLSVGYGAGSTGIVNISDDADVQIGATIFLGLHDFLGARGEIHQTGGTVTVVSGVDVGDGDESSGLYDISGGSLTAPGFTMIGWSGSTDAVMNVSGDAVLTLGSDTSAVQVGAQTYGDNDGETQGDPNFGQLWGKPTSGVLNQSGGTLNILGNLQVASGSRATGVVEMSGGTLDVTGVTFLTVGQATEFEPGVLTTASATFNQSGGEATLREVAFVGIHGQGTLNVTGGTFTSVAAAESINIGIFDTSSGSSMTVSSGEVIAQGRVRLGEGDAENTSLNVSGDAKFTTDSDLLIGSLLDNEDGIARNNGGSVIQTGGEVSVGVNTILGYEAVIEGEVEGRSHGTYNMSGGKLTMNDLTIVGLGGTGTFLQSGGDVDAKIGVVLAGDVGSVGTYELSGGTLELNRTAIEAGEGEATFELSGGRLSGASEVILPELAQTGGVLSTGVDVGATLISGDYDISGEGVLEIKVGGLLPIEEHDVYEVEGTASLGGSLSVVLLEGFVPQVGDLIEVLTSTGSGIVGEFDELLFPSNPFDVSGQLVYDGSSVFLEITEGGLDPVLGDTNGDRVVDLTDLNNVRNNFGGTGFGDANGDGVVDLADLNAVRNNFGTVGSASSPDTSSVPGFDLEAGPSLLSRLDGISHERLSQGDLGGLYQEKFRDDNGLASANPVPEPATWGLGLVTSLAALVAFGRRKK
jgi:hypothetical protein